MALVITYESDTRRLKRAMEMGWGDSDPVDVAFSLPKEAKKGDKVLYFVGGKFQYFFGQGTVTSNWQSGRAGPWRGLPYIWTSPLRRFLDPIPGQDVEDITGFKSPRKMGVVPPTVAENVWRAARGKPLIEVERAMEGATTEARSKYRNAALRRSALQLAGGVCEGCRVNFSKRAKGKGVRCLVVHHKKQLKDTDQPRETKISELAVLCGNCHLLVHSDKMRALTIPQLRRLLGK